MLDGNRLRELYENARKLGYRDDYKTFADGFTRPENYNKRKQLYDVMTANGASIGDTYEDFMKRMQKHGGSSAPASNKPYGNSFGQLQMPDLSKAASWKESPAREWTQRQLGTYDQTKDLERDVKKAVKKAQEPTRDQAQEFFQQIKDEADYRQMTGKKLSDFGSGVPGSDFLAPNLKRNADGTIVTGDNGEPLVGFSTDEARNGASNYLVEKVAEREAQEKYEEENAPKPIKGFGEAFKQGTRMMWEGLKNIGAETANLVTGSNQEYLDAIKHLDLASEYNKSDRYNEYKDSFIHSDEWKNFRDGFIDDESLLSKLNPLKYGLRKLAAHIENKALREALEHNNYSISAARKELEAKARANESWGDRVKRDVLEAMEKQRPTEGFGAWVGNIAPQMMPSAIAMAASVATKNPAYLKAIAATNLGTMAASTAGLSMSEARKHGASDLQAWGVGLLDGGIEMWTEKIPLDRYTKRLLGFNSKAVKKAATEALTNPNSPAKQELQRLLQQARKKLGGKLFAGKNVKEFAGDILAEGLSEFTAEALETITPMIYQNPEEYPTLAEIFMNGLEGAKAGVFMGSVLGSASKGLQYAQNKQRIKQQGYIDVAQVQNSEDPLDASIVEVLGRDKDGGIVVRDGDEVRTVNNSDIQMNHRFTYDEFRKAKVEYDGDSDEALTDAIDDNTAAGYNAEDEQQAATFGAEYNAAREKAVGVFSDDMIELLDNDPVYALAQMRRDEQYIDEQLAAAVDYVNAKAARDGAMQRMEDDLDSAVEAARGEVSQRMNGDDFLIHRAQLKAENEDGTPKYVYITGGSVVLREDGSVDVGGSDQTIVVRDANTGKIEMISPSKIQSVDEAIDPQEEYAQAEAEARAAYEQKKARVLEGRTEEPEVPGETDVPVENLQTEAPQAEIKSKEEQAENQQIEEEQGNPPQIKPQTEGENLQTETQTQTEQATAENPIVEQAEIPVEKDKKGNVVRTLYHRVPMQRTLEDLYDGSLDQEEIDRFVENLAADAKKRLVSVENEKKPQIGSNKQAYLEAKKRYEERLADARSEVEYYDNLQKEVLRVTQRGGQQTGVAEDLGGEPLSLEELAARFASEYKVTPESLKGETGMSGKELKGFVGLVAKEENSGVSIERLGELLARSDEWAQLGGTPEMTQEARNMLIDAYMSGNPRSYVKQQRERFAQREAEHEMNEIENFAQAAFGMSAEEYLAYEEQALPAIINKYAGFDFDIYYAILQEQADARANEAEANYNNSINGNTNEQQGESNGNGGSGGILQTEGTADEQGERTSDEQEAGGQGGVGNAGLQGVGTQRNVGEGERANTDDRRGGNGSLAGREQGGLAQEELDENGISFVLASNGTTTFGEIGEESGLQPAPIRLSEGFQGEDGKGYGLAHIEANHGEQIRNAGFSSVEEFVEFVAKNYDEDNIRVGKRRDNGNTTFLIQVQDEHDNTLFIEMSRDGSYWNVNSAGIFRKGYSNKKETVAKTEPQQPNNAISGGSSLSTDAEGGITSAEPNGEPTVSAGKVTEKENSVQTSIANAEAETETAPSEAQNKAGNYKKGHLKIDGFDVTIENPKGSVRSGVDADGEKWEQTMNNTYGYIRGTEGVDGDHIDVFLSDDPSQGDVFVVDQVNKDGTFDEHKVMYGFASEEEARNTYLSNYEDGWTGLGAITRVSKEEFKKWVDSSHRKTKPFAEYKGVKKTEVQGVPGSNAGKTAVSVIGSMLSEEESARLSELRARDRKSLERRELEEMLTLERKDRILREGTYYDKPFGLKPVREISRAEDIDENVSKIIKGLKAHEGDGRFKDFEGFSYGGNYAKNAGRQIDEYLQALIDVIPFDITKAWCESHGLETHDDVYSYGERLYNAEKTEGQNGETHGKADSQGNPLSAEVVAAVIDAMKAQATVAPTIEITDDSWKDSIKTPIGNVKMGAHQKEKLFTKGRGQQYGMLVETLSNPDIVLEEMDKTENLFHERPSSYLFVKTFQKEDGSKYIHFESVTVSQEGMEVSVSSHIIRENQLKNKLKSDRLLYKATALDAPAITSAEQPIKGGSLSSEGKVTEKNNSAQQGSKEADKAEGTDKAEATGKTDVPGSNDGKSDGNATTDNQGNPLNEDGTLKLEKIASVDELTDEDFSKPTRNVELPALPKNVNDAIGANGKPVIIKKNIFVRNAERHSDLSANDSRNILKAALYNPNLYGQNQKAKRPYNWVVINTKDKEGKNRLVLIELSPEKENAEIVHWYYLRDESLETIKRQAEREGGHILILPSESSEEAGGLSSRTPDLSSEGKDRNNPVISQRNGVRNDGVDELVSDATSIDVEDVVSFPKEIREEDVISKEQNGGKGRNGIKVKAGLLGNDLYIQYREGRSSKDKRYWATIKIPNATNHSAGQIIYRLGYLGTFTDIERLAGDAVLELFNKNGLRLQKGEAKEVSPREAAMRDALVDVLRGAGVEVVTDAEEGQRVLDAANGGMRLQAKKRALETASVTFDEEHQPTVVSSADGAKLLKELDRLTEDFENLSNQTKFFIGTVAKALGAQRYNSKSEYATFETKSGRVVTIRLADHNAAASNFDNRGELDGISIVISPKPNQGIINDGNAHIVEYYYDAIKLRRADGKPLADIVRSIKQALYSGEFKDATGIAEVQEVNVLNVRVKLNKRSSTEAERIGKETQLDIINKTNPAPDDYHTWVRTTDDILTLQEAVDEVLGEDPSYELSSYPDVSDDVIRDALKTGKITVYSSYPIANGVFVTPSMMQAADYAGGMKVYSKVVSISDVAWLSTDEGQYATTKEDAGSEGDEIRFFRTADGHAYGFTVGGKIYIDPRIAGADTPIHEYTHLWAEALRKANPKEWENIVRLMKGTGLWEEVKRRYPELTTDSEIADEVLAHYSGKRGAERLRKAQEEALKNGNGILEKTAAVAAINNVRTALKRFWKGVADFFGVHFNSAEEVADKVLSDMLNGVKPEVTGKTDTALAKEEADIIAKAKADGTYLRAPNGKPTNLTPRQWVQVRTKAFKKWFGDWEKRSRIEKLRKSESASITGEEIEITDDYKQNKKNAMEYGKRLQGEYTNADTGLSVQLQRGRHNGGIKEVLQHNYKDAAHLLSVAAIPQIIEKSVYIESEANNDTAKNPDVVEYQHFVCGLKIGNEDYTVYSLVAVDKHGNRYYDHNLTHIEKTKLLDSIERQAVKGQGFDTTSSTELTTLNGYKGKKLLEILQTDCSKVVDENGEPKVVLHGTPNTFTAFDKNKIGSSNDPGWLGSGFYFYGNNEDYARSYSRGGNLMEVFLNIRDPYYASYSEMERLAEENSREASDEFREMVEDEGCDGVYYNADLNEEWVAFEPTQIKSATDNVDTFDGSNTEIRYQFVGENGAGSNAETDIPGATEELARDGRGAYTDDKVSMENDPWSKMAGYNIRSKKERMAFAERERRRMVDKITDMAERLGIADDVEIVTDLSGLQGRQRRAKGIYRKSSGKITIYIPNHINVADAVATFLHEAVAHKGLRNLFGKHFDEFLDKVYDNVDGKIWDAIDALAKKKGLSTRTATEEYLAGLAESTDFEHLPYDGWWQRVKEFFIDMLHKVGIKALDMTTLTDNELRYILWRSYRYMQGKDKGIIAFVEDTAMKMKLGVGYSEKEGTSGAADVAGKTDVSAKNTKNSARSVFDNLKKQQAFDKMFLFKVGDNYEILYEDAKSASEILGLPLQEKDGKEFVSFPVKDLDKNLALLVRGGAYVAVDNNPVEELSRVGETEVPGDTDIPGSIEEVNKRFNDELKRYERKELPAGHRFELGYPSKYLLSAGFDNLPISMRASLLSRKAGDEFHPFNASSLKDLVKRLQKPIAVFKYSKDNMRNVIVEAKSNGKHFLVGITLNFNANGLEINSVSGLFPKESHEWIKWIQDGKAIRIDGKAKVQDLIDSLRTNPAESERIGLNLNDIAKIVENFENPKIEGENSEEVDVEADELFREAAEVDKAKAATIYNNRIKSGMYQTYEAMLDSMAGLKEAMMSVLKAEGSSIKYIEDVPDSENAYLGENRLSSVNEAECEAFQRTLFDPLLREVAYIAKTDKERRELTDYMMMKHGLERNAYMRKEAAKKKEETDRDFAGLTTLLGIEDVYEAEAEAQRLIEEYEAGHNTDTLWKCVKDVTQATLRKSYECGIISKDTFYKTILMYDYYIPLRGFSDKTSSEEYTYLNHSESSFNAPIRTARGRSSKADDPILQMQLMAESAILQGNRNRFIKQRFLNFAERHRSDLISIQGIWLKYDDALEEWRPVFADINEYDTPEEALRKQEEFDERMEALAESDKEHFKKQSEHPEIPYRVVEKRDLREHQVLVKRGGIDYVLTINGSPRAAQAVNGKTNPDNVGDNAVDRVLEFCGNINRTLSMLYTTASPDFVVGNFARDCIYANTMVWAKEGAKYAAKFNANYVMLSKPGRMKLLFEKYRKGKLDMSNERERLFLMFIKNGGETGFLRMGDVDQYRDKIKKKLRGASAKIPAGEMIASAATWIGEVGRAVETQARFAAFMTSMQAGRSIGRSIWDAKEISVNFNKKGAGDKFMGGADQTKVGNVSAFTSALGRCLYVFWNAGLQGTFNNFGKTLVRNPKKTTAVMAASFALGLIVSMLGKMAGDDDGDDNGDDEETDTFGYYDISKHTRRQNLVVKIPGTKSWFKLPLPIEFRAMYGMGELAGSTIFGGELLSAGDMLAQVSQLMPIDAMEGWRALIPSLVKPAADAYVNETWYGTPIYKDTPFNMYLPDWTKAPKNTNKYLVDLAETLNEMTGGDKYSKGKIDMNPARWEYLLRQYGGGIFTVASQLTSLYSVANGSKEADWRYVPLLNRFVMSSGDHKATPGLNERYFEIMDKLKSDDSRISAIKKDYTIGQEEQRKLIGEVVNDEMYRTLKAFDYEYKVRKQYLNYYQNIGDVENAKKAAREIKELKMRAVEYANKKEKEE